MPSPSPDAGGGGRDWSRRAVLALGLTLGAGCTLSDPAVRGPQRPAGASATSASPSPSPTPSRTAVAAAATELALIELTRAAETADPRPGEALRPVLKLLRSAHAERWAALSSADPAARSTAAPPGASPTPTAATKPVRPAAALSQLVKAERAAAGRYRTNALASEGLSALLWGSMSVASSRFARALDADDPPSAPDPRPHRPLTLVSDTEALAAMVSSLHAAVYGYQLALGRLEVGSPTHDRALQGLGSRRTLLDRLSDQLGEAGAEVPAAEPAYVPRPQPTDARTAGQLIRRMESALVPFCGLWLAAAGRPADRRFAFDTLAATVATAESWGAPLQAWPGWRD